MVTTRSQTYSAWFVVKHPGQMNFVLTPVANIITNPSSPSFLPTKSSDYVLLPRNLREGWKTPVPAQFDSLAEEIAALQENADQDFEKRLVKEMIVKLLCDPLKNDSVVRVLWLLASDVMTYVSRTTEMSQRKRDMIMSQGDGFSEALYQYIRNSRIPFKCRTLLELRTLCDRAINKYYKFLKKSDAEAHEAWMVANEADVPSDWSSESEMEE